MRYSRIILLATLATLFTTFTYAAQLQIDGQVTDEQGQPVSYANVVLLSLPDTTFVDGGVTDSAGVFNIATEYPDALLRVSSVGYRTAIVPVGKGLIIRLEEETELLDEVVIKSTLPKTFAKGDAMRTNIEGSILEKAGAATDLLKKIPTVETDRDGGVRVLGRGDAEVYINGRKVQDKAELTRLTADQIQYVEVVQNPGAQYAASTKAVIRIRTKRAQGEGFSFREYAQGMYRYGFTIANNLDLNYRYGGLDVTGSIWAGRYGHRRAIQQNDLIYKVGSDNYLSRSISDAREIWSGYSPQLQINYVVNDNHSFGAFYKFDRHPHSEYHGLFATDNFVNDLLTEKSESDVWQDERFSKHIFNAYYNGRIGKLGIDLNVDGLFDLTTTPGKTTEKTIELAPADTTYRSINSETLSGNRFIAAKLILSYPIWRGNLSLGGEYSYNHRTDAYNYLASETLPVQTTNTVINEQAPAGFIEYSVDFWGKVYAQVGLRYEHIINDYYDFGVRQDEVCRNYGDWFPTAAISVPINEWQLALSYRRDIKRPAYSYLTSSTIYINRYSYQSGNPYLLPTYTHSLVLNVGWRWINFMASYGRTTGEVIMSTEPYPGADDPMISLLRPLNSPNPYDRGTFNLTLQPTIAKIWHPQWTAVCMIQNYKTPSSSGETITLGRPFFVLNWENTIELPLGFRINANFEYQSKGDYDNIRLLSHSFDAELGLQYDLDLKRAGLMTFDARCSDIFNTNVTNAMLYGIRDFTLVTPAMRTFTLSLTWRFNNADSKYRGTGAGNSQKSRM